jgi:hypothetical protein
LVRQRIIAGFALAIAVSSVPPSLRAGGRSFPAVAAGIGDMRISILFQ